MKKPLPVISEDQKNKRVEDTWYIGKFTEYIKEKDLDCYRYLLDISSGLMVYIGVYHVENYTNESQQKYKGTCFFLDTKIILRLLGYSRQLEIDCACELVKIIQNEYAGKVCYFEKNLEEAKFALTSAGEAIQKGDRIRDNEMDFYVTAEKSDAVDLGIYSESIKGRLEKEFNCTMPEAIDWNSENTRKGNIDWGKLTEFIAERHPKWKEPAIRNDVAAINHINVLRENDYTVQFGGKNKLPIFVTSNYFLVSDVRDYSNNNLTEPVAWTQCKLPLIGSMYPVL